MKKETIITISIVSGTLLLLGIGGYLWYSKAGGKAALIGEKKDGTIKAKDFFTPEELAILAADKNVKA